MELKDSANSSGRVAGPGLAGFALGTNFNAPILNKALLMLAGFAVSFIWLPVARGDDKEQASTAADTRTGKGQEYHYVR